MVEVSGPSGKNKGVARAGRPAGFLIRVMTLRRDFRAGGDGDASIKTGLMAFSKG
jgi:hypothetical protein